MNAVNDDRSWFDIDHDLLDEYRQVTHGDYGAASGMLSLGTRPRCLTGKPAKVFFRKNDSTVWQGLFGILLVVVVGSVLVGQKTTGSIDTQRQAGNAAAGAGEVSKTQDNQVAIMKEILVRLVKTVEQVSAAASNPVAAGTVVESRKGVPITVKVNMATLRREPNLDSATISNLKIGTQLLATKVMNGWVRVSAPTGEEAWIRKDLISARRP